jgi:BirA family biotin operon repressor/biotin-[acetyl-CoA-carboxylase] ligase
MEGWPVGVGREILETVDSTNAEALRRAAAGEIGPLWILTRRQTAARGRRGRAWAAPEGNFGASLLMRPTGQLALRSFAASLGLFDAMVAATGRPELFALKWPNDVLLSGGKLAGILLEGGANGTLVIGIGVNLASAPAPEAVEAGALRPVSLRQATGLTVTPEDFLDLLAPAVAAWEARLSDMGFAPVRTAWLARAARIGEQIVARLPGREIAGRFETVDESGALVVATETGRVALPAAEIHFARVAEVGDAACD